MFKALTSSFFSVLIVKLKLFIGVVGIQLIVPPSVKKSIGIKNTKELVGENDEIVEKPKRNCGFFKHRDISHCC